MGQKLKTPCCNNGKDIYSQSPLSDDIRMLYYDINQCKNAHKINHASSFVTAGILRTRTEDGHGFHYPETPPCFLSLEGTVLHWQQPLARLNDVGKSWWIAGPPAAATTNDDPRKLDVQITEFRAMLIKHNPVARLHDVGTLLHTLPTMTHTVELHCRMPTDTDDAVGVYCDTAADDEVPPKLEYWKWLRHDTSKYVSTCEIDMCTCPRLYPTGAGGWTTAVGMKYPE